MELRRLEEERARNEDVINMDAGAEPPTTEMPVVASRKMPELALPKDRVVTDMLAKLGRDKAEMGADHKVDAEVLDPAKVKILLSSINRKVRDEAREFKANNPTKRFAKKRTTELVTKPLLAIYLGVKEIQLDDESIVPSDILEELQYMLTLKFSDLESLAKDKE